MSFKEDLKKRGARLMSDPRVFRLLQDERFVTAMAAVLKVPGRIGSFTSEQSERLAAAMQLATAEELRELRYRVARLEDDVDELKRRLHERQD